MSDSPGPSASIALATRTRASCGPSAGPRPHDRAARAARGQEALPVLRHPRPHLRQLEVLAQPLARLDQIGGQVGRAVLVALAPQHRERALGEVEAQLPLARAVLGHHRALGEEAVLLLERRLRLREAAARRRAPDPLLGQQPLQRRPPDRGDACSRRSCRPCSQRDPLLQREGVRHVAVDHRDAVLLARHHLAQHHRLLHARRDGEKGALLAEPAQDAARLALDAGVGGAGGLNGRDGHGRQLLGDRGAAVSAASSAANSLAWSRAIRSSASSISGSSRHASTRRIWRSTVEAWQPWHGRAARIGMPAGGMGEVGDGSVGQPAGDHATRPGKHAKRWGAGSGSTREAAPFTEIFAKLVLKLIREHILTLRKTLMFPICCRFVAARYDRQSCATPLLLERVWADKKRMIGTLS